MKRQLHLSNLILNIIFQTIYIFYVIFAITMLIMSNNYTASTWGIVITLILIGSYGGILIGVLFLINIIMNIVCAVVAAFKSLSIIKNNKINNQQMQSQNL
ncbi:hypothetical protein DMC14_000935 [Metamycoplasma phocicerebrale]|uniref:DUF4282 domain-containing protein n=1 Tax=Metamycoplasma phocicerebrale TaxID=142649 RepID=A0A3Q9VA07_9BACT|nr:hypothetical protein [Metamycoplasma phocicerebrale]AZZ65358.1 hypothetical protein DMC14_000935 [Metamycoplasma phocicerebrale]